ncbi:MAG: hypothetical protein LBF16_03995 [Pseudomonadales bacterium]|jgi:hypothetical protein|nr:hypothetical protein [Pseudomonadales bacterium]
MVAVAVDTWLQEKPSATVLFLKWPYHALAPARRATKKCTNHAGKEQFSAAVIYRYGGQILSVVSQQSHAVLYGLYITVQYGIKTALGEPIERSKPRRPCACRFGAHAKV